MSRELGGCELNECGAEVVVFVYSSNVATSIASRALAIATQGKFVLIFFFVVVRCVCVLCHSSLFWLYSHWVDSLCIFDGAAAAAPSLLMQHRHFPNMKEKNSK